MSCDWPARGCSGPERYATIVAHVQERAQQSCAHGVVKPACAYLETFMGTSVLISILITFLVIVLVLWLVQRLPLDGRLRQIIQVIVIVIGIISLLKYLAVF
jgi:hypothetical protein